jgi:hypothetical protein
MNENWRRYPHLQHVACQELQQLSRYSDWAPHRPELCSDNCLGLYSGSIRFETSPRHLLLQLRILLVLLSLSKQMSGQYLDYTMTGSYQIISNSILIMLSFDAIQGVPERKVNFLGGHSIGHYKQKLYMYMCPILNGFRDRATSLYSTLYTVHCTDEQHAMSSHELRSAMMLTVEFSEMYLY